MRTIVDLPDEHVNALDSMGRKMDVSRAELVRRAVEQYLHAETKKSSGDVDKYFGIFKDDPAVFGGLDGLAYQRKMRAEWDARDALIDERLKNSRGLHDDAKQDYQDKE